MKMEKKWNKNLLKRLAAAFLSQCIRQKTKAFKSTIKYFHSIPIKKLKKKWKSMVKMFLSNKFVNL
jgi:hypothetical protein